MGLIKLPGCPTYQLKLQDVSPSGAGIIVRADSKFLTLVAVGQELSVRLLSPINSENVMVDYKAKVVDISELKDGRYKGHFVVGLLFIKEMSERERS
jgi:PilZ domain